MVSVFSVQTGSGGGWFQFAMFLRFMCAVSCRTSLLFSVVVQCSVV